MNFQSVFKKKKNIVIGAIHLPPLLGFPDFPGFRTAIKNALQDLRSLEKGGIDAVIFENNYDLPHTREASPASVSSMLLVGAEIKKDTKLPVGVSVLWNDYRSALLIAKTLNLQFIRVPVFVDKVKTSYGVVEGKPKGINSYRKVMKAEKVLLFTDIHVKHAKLLSRYSLQESARRAIQNHSDALIVTGNWTGQAPDLKELVELRKSIGNFPVLVGSGLDKTNIAKLFEFANGAIVSTSLKSGGKQKGEVNIKPYNARISQTKVQELIKKIDL